MEDPDIGLCFELPSSHHERYLIPQALSANEPEYGMWPADSLRFRFTYDFLPPGLIPRFIVQAHRNLTEKGPDGEPAWCSGQRTARSLFEGIVIADASTSPSLGRPRGNVRR